MIVGRSRRSGSSAAFLPHVLLGRAAGGWLAQADCADQPHRRRGVAGTVRGMHFQYPPHAEMKLVNCLRGEVWDVAVDLRAGSPTFLRWFGVRAVGRERPRSADPGGLCARFSGAGARLRAALFSHRRLCIRQARAASHPIDPRLAIAMAAADCRSSRRAIRHIRCCRRRFEGLAS